jgi:folylpolyglutamate synthase/dihydropteroate synthase
MRRMRVADRRPVLVRPLRELHFGVVPARVQAPGRCRSRKTKINAATDLAHTSKAIAAMSKKPKAAAAM